jgi:hypothetical protein
VFGGIESAGLLMITLGFYISFMLIVLAVWLDCRIVAGSCFVSTLLIVPGEGIYAFKH